MRFIGRRTRESYAIIWDWKSKLKYANMRICMAQISNKRHLNIS